MPHDRRSARILAMQALCQWDVQRDESPETLEELCRSTTEDAIDPAALGFARELVTGFWSQRDAVDGRIGAASPKWDLERMSSVERNSIRVAVVEMLGTTTPPRVALDEAIEIVKEYGGGDSPRFVNGVLDQVYRKVQAETGRT